MVTKRRKSEKDASASRKGSSHGHAVEASKLALHRINGALPWSPASIVSMASSRDGHLCACVRENGRVDLYDVDVRGTSGTSSSSSSTLWSGSKLVKSIPATENASPSSVVLVDAQESNRVRMFVGSMDGTVTEVDTGRRAARLTCDSHGGAVWALDAIACGGSSDGGDGGDGGAGDKRDTGEPGGGTTVLGALTSTTYTHKLAAACDDGSVKIFGVESDDVPGVTLVKSFLPVEGRALSVAWDPRAGACRVVSGGSDGCVHVWDAESGREVMRITVDGSGCDVNGPDASKTCVWAVKVLGDGTIVSGDSLGQVTFWDGKFGTMIAKFNPNGADILALEASLDGSLVFAAGVDPRIAVFRRVVGDGEAQSSWAYLSSKQEHVLDVRALCCCGERLFSGGNDALVISHSVGRFLKEHPIRVDAVPVRPMVSRLGKLVSCSSRSHSPSFIMASASLSGVHIWQMKGQEHGNSLVNIAHLENSRRAELTAVATSSDGRFVAFGDIQGVQCVELRQGVDIGTELENNPSVVPIPILDDDVRGDEDAQIAASAMTMAVVDINVKDIGEGVTHLEFLPNVAGYDEAEGDKNGHRLVVCFCDGTIKLVDGVGSDSPTIHTIRDIHDLKYKTWFKRESSKTTARRESPMIDIARVATNADNTPILAVVVLNRIFVLNLDTRKVVTQIPSTAGTVAAIGFVQDGDKLLVATTASEIGLFDTSSGDMCGFAGIAEPDFHDLALGDMGPILGIEPIDNANRAVIFSAHAICCVDVTRKLADEESTLAGLGRRNRDKRAKRDVLRAEQGRNPRVIRYEHPILACAGMGGNELVIVEGSFDRVWRSKMAPIRRQRYGT